MLMRHSIHPVVPTWARNERKNGCWCVHCAFVHACAQNEMKMWTKNVDKHSDWPSAVFQIVRNVHVHVLGMKRCLQKQPAPHEPARGARQRAQRCRFAGHGVCMALNLTFPAVETLCPANRPRTSQRASAKCSRLN